MSFVEVFYPGNQKKRENCVRLMHEIYSAMKRNFAATNSLIKIMHTRLKIQCDALVFYTDKTIRKNAKNFMKKIKEIQRLLEVPLQEYSTEVDPYIYNMLFNENLELTKVFDYLRIGGKTLHLIAQVAILLTAVVASIGCAVTIIVATLSQIWIGAIVVCSSVILVGVEAIYSAIVGAKERDKLESTEAELKGVVDEFVPVSEKYMKEINRLEFRIEDL